MIRKFLMLGLLTMMVGLFPATGVVRAGNSAAGSSAHFSSTHAQVRRFGPYATLRRANEVANYARRLGYNAKIIYAGSFYAGTREYYVDVWV